MRHQLLESAGGLRRQTLKDILEVAVRIVSVELGGLDQAHDDSGTLPGAQGAGEEPVRTTNSHHAVILPISGEKLKFTTAGIPSMAGVYELTTANSALAAASSTWRSKRVS